MNGAAPAVVKYSCGIVARPGRDGTKDGSWAATVATRATKRDVMVNEFIVGLLNNSDVTAGKVSKYQG